MLYYFEFYFFKEVFMKKAVVIGSGHAGVEAGLALARMGIDTTLLTLNLDSISFLACNPSIGGTAKGHLVCEIDALGGQMGINTDATLIQLRMLNLGKGPAVQSLRAQADKNEYHNEMKRTIEDQKNLHLKQAEATEIVVENGEVKAVKTAQGDILCADAVVVATGVYLNSNIIIGDYTRDVGPNGFCNAKHLTQSLIDIGFTIRRFKTGTPARVHFDSLDLSKMTAQYGDENIQTFSFLTDKQPENKTKCYLTYTTEKTKDIILKNLDRCPMFNGAINGIGPRYCPSIESKIVRFADKERHQVFLEPESLSTKEYYVQGVSTSMPIDVQKEMYRSIIGLENVEILRDAYAIEYDCIDSTELYPTLAFKKCKGLYTAGQINGSSGYEEAGAQGLIAGINAGLYLLGKEPLILKRNESYIGVLIDDLVTKGTNEPYRMMTSRAEYRLHLRQDNADLRLTPYSIAIGLASEERKARFEKRLAELSQAKSELKCTFSPDSVRELFEATSENLPKSGITLDGIIRRNNIDAIKAKQYLNVFDGVNDLTLKTLSTDIKYDGYLKREDEQIERFMKNEKITLPKDYDYSTIYGLRKEAQEKLNHIKPTSLGQASRISGVNPADIAVLLCNFKR